MRNVFYLYAKGLIILFCLLPLTIKSQICNQTELWVSTGYPSYSVIGFTELNGKLYTVNRNGHPGFFLYQYDGNSWNAISQLPLPLNWGCCFLNDIITYKNQIYVCGSFKSGATQIPGTESIIRWDSTNNQWVGVGTGIGGGTISSVIDMEVYKGELYACGAFFNLGSMYAPAIVRWNGVYWDTLSSTSYLQFAGSGSGWPSVWSMTVWNEKLVLGGNFKTPGSKYLVTWDGSNFADFQSYPNAGISLITTFHDDLIIYGQYIDSMGNQPSGQVIKWDGASWKSINPPGSYLFPIDFQSFKGDLYMSGTGNRLPNNIQFDGVVRWDGKDLHPMSSLGMTNELHVFNKRLWVAGYFYSSCGYPVDDIVRLCEGTECQSFGGRVFQDDNRNCIKDPLENYISQQWVQIDPVNVLVQTDDSGYFFTVLDTGMYHVSIHRLKPYYSNSCPQNGYIIQIDSFGVQERELGIFPIPNIHDLKIIVTATPMRPGGNAYIHLNITNDGTVVRSPQINLILDSLLNFTGNCTYPLANQSGQHLSWQWPSLVPSQSAHLKIEVTLPTHVLAGTELAIQGEVYPIQTDSFPRDNIFLLPAIVVASFDPNDKQVSPAGQGPNGNIPPQTKTLTYTIRFQNTGNDTAFTVILRDEIDSTLDLSTLQTIASSHNYRFVVEEGQRINWTFDNILLPDSNTNEPASHGFVKYRIDLRENLPLGTRIENEAAIYFDFNSPIITNRTVNTLAEPVLSIDAETTSTKLKIWPQPAGDWVNIESPFSLSQARVQLFDLHGRRVYQASDLEGKHFRIPAQALAPGLYLLHLHQDGALIASAKLVIR